MTPTPNDPLSETAIAEKVVARLQRTSGNRASQVLGAVAGAPTKSPMIYWVLGIAVMAYGIVRMERHPHATTDAIHLISDWALISLGIAFVPGAAQKVIALVGGLASYLPFLKKPDTPPAPQPFDFKKPDPPMSED